MAQIRRHRAATVRIAAAILTMTVVASPARADDPVANAGPDQVVQEQTLVQLDGSGSFHPDGHQIFFFWTQTKGPAVALDDPQSPRPRFLAPDVNNNETIEFRLRVSDAFGEDDNDEVKVTVVATQNNRPPDANAGPDQTVTSGSVVTLNGTGSSDPDGDVITFAWQQIQGPDVGLNDPNSPTPSFTAPPVAGPTNLVFRLVVADPHGLSDADTVTVTVHSNPVNRPPQANAGPDQSVSERATVTLNGTGSFDPDGDAITFFWQQTQGPGVALNDPASPTPSFTAPEVESATPLVFLLNVTDPHGASSSDSVTITVQNIHINNPPTADAGPDQTATEGLRVTLDGTDSFDPDNDPLTFLWEQVSGPPASLDNPTSPTPSFTAPDVVAPQNLRFRLTVTDDDGATGADVTNVTVTPGIPGNQPPVANAGPDQTVGENDVVTLNGTGSFDPDGGPLAYSWVHVSGPVVLLDNAASPTPQFRAPPVDADDVVTLRLTVEDDKGATNSDTVAIRILNTVQAPPGTRAAIEDLRVAPNPFNPTNRRQAILYRLSSSSRVTIRIYDFFGELVREMEIPSGSEGGREGLNLIEWDGRNGSGEVVGNAGYIVRVEAVNADNTKAAAIEKSAVVK